MSSCQLEQPVVDLYRPIQLYDRLGKSYTVSTIALPRVRATPVVLNFLRETKVGKMITMAPLEVEEEDMGEIKQHCQERGGG